MHLGWNAWYLDRMEYYERTLDSLIIEIESYLKEHLG
jgi:hypothetical protein